MKNNYKNIIAFALDESGSMGHLKNKVIDVYNQQIENLIKKSKEFEQETRVSVFSFNDDVKNLIWDSDVLRAPDISKTYSPGGSTALIDGTLQTIEDIKKIPQIYGDFSYLIIVISDGDNNINNYRSTELNKTLKDLPDNYTLVFLAPNDTAKADALRYGFLEGNIQLWDVSEIGLKKAGNTIQQATDNFMVMRSQGVKGTKNLFNIDTTKLSGSAIKSNLSELSASQYELIPVHGSKAVKIKDYVESWTKQSYRVGGAYYQLTKPETIQPSKQICIQHKTNGKVYSGLNARKVISLPDYEVKVNPVNYGEYNVYVQSTSTNRNLIPGQMVLVMK